MKFSIYLNWRVFVMTSIGHLNFFSTILVLKFEQISFTKGCVRTIWLNGKLCALCQLFDHVVFCGAWSRSSMFPTTPPTKTYLRARAPSENLDQPAHSCSLNKLFSKNTCELDIVLTRTVNILTTIELVKLTTLWTTGPRLSTLSMLGRPLRKHAYSNILRILPPKNENFRMKRSGSCHISALNIDLRYSLELPRRRTASARRFLREPTIYVFQQKYLIYIYIPL